MCACMCVVACACMCICVHVHVPACVCGCTGVHIHVCACMRVLWFKWVCVWKESLCGDLLVLGGWALWVLSRSFSDRVSTWRLTKILRRRRSPTQYSGNLSPYSVTTKESWWLFWTGDSWPGLYWESLSEWSWCVVWLTWAVFATLSWSSLWLVVLCDLKSVCVCLDLSEFLTIIVVLDTLP